MLQRFWDLLCESQSHLPETQFEAVKDLIDRLLGWAEGAPDDSGAYLLKGAARFFHSWSNDIMQTAVGERFYKDNPRLMRLGLMRSARLEYLSVVADKNFFSQDCLHIKDVYFGIAAAD